MLLFPQADLAFLSIPKSAGQSVTPALRAALSWDPAPSARDLGLPVEEYVHCYEMGRGMVHPALGPIKAEHLPLRYWRDHFPHSWEAFRKTTGFVLVRAPRDRFFSAVLQRLGEFLDMKGLRADDPLVREEAARVCEWLAGKPHFHQPEYIHFTRQIDYVELDGERWVEQVFPLEQTGGAAQQWVCAHTGAEIDFAHTHARREPKSWAGKVQPLARFVGRTLLPKPLKRAIYPLWMNSGAFADASSRYRDIALDADVERFIADYYAADAALHAQALAAPGAPPAMPQRARA